MTTHDRPRPDFASNLLDLETTLLAYEGLDILMTPDGDLSARDRDRVAILIGVLNKIARAQIEALYDQRNSTPPPFFPQHLQTITKGN